MLTKTEERIYDVLNEYKYEPVKRDTIWRKLFGGLVAILLIGLGIYFFIGQPIQAQEIVHKFKNPSFSGQGTGARKAAERAEDNTTLAKFIRNLESRIYAQMAKQLVESMFSNDNPVRFGSFVLEGSTITYEVITNDDGTEFIRMTIVDADGTSTVIEIPIGTGYFGGDSDGDGSGDG